MVTKKIPITIAIDGRTTVIGSAELDEDGNTLKAEVDEEYVHLIQGQIDKRFALAESPKDRVIREEAARHNVFKDQPSRRGESDA